MNTSMRLALVAVLFTAFTLTSQSYAQRLVTIETVTVGDAGNAADTTGYGAVTNAFAIGKYEVTLSQYTSFLNSAAKTDIYRLYNNNMTDLPIVAGISRSGVSGSYTYSVIGSGNRPVTYVSWFDAARFANWMHNGATNGASTETGAYSLNGATNGIVLKNPGATWWIPSEDEWYKAAYYDVSAGGPVDDYWLYPTRSDSQPGNVIGAGTNQANIYSGGFSVTQSGIYDGNQNYLTGAGDFGSSGSYYGTFDQGGNVWEWNDAVNGSSRGIRGGSWASFYGDLESSVQGDSAPEVEGSGLGFRVATVPEPSTYALLTLAAAGLGAHVLRRRRK